MDEKFEVEGKLLQAILEYLANQPYKDVFQLINGIQQLKPMKPE
jgi:hypothetical protein